MQNRYVGDVGDFGKYGLLRALAAPCARWSTLRLAVLWYLVSDESHNADGKHVSYLQTPPDGPYASCDAALFRALQRLVKRGRNVALIATDGILPLGTRFHADPLSFSAVDSVSTRRARRRAWFDGARRVADGADLVFLDPDNGLECCVRAHTRKGPKYAFYADIQELLSPTTSLVVYHHLCRRSTAAEQVASRGQALARILPDTHSVGALRYRRGSARAFFFAVADRHRKQFGHRIRTFLESPWSQHFVLDPLPGLGGREL